MHHAISNTGSAESGYYGQIARAERFDAAFNSRSDQLRDDRDEHHVADSDCEQ